MAKSWKYKKHHSEEAKSKISIANKLAYANPELRKKISKKLKGKHSSPKTEFKSGHKNGFQKGYAPWNTGLKGEENPLWRGDNVSYTAKHMWLYTNFGKAKKCENPKCCYSNPKRYSWANLSKEYKRIREDWIQLCMSCHKKFDLSKKEWEAFLGQ